MDRETLYTLQQVLKDLYLETTSGYDPASIRRSLLDLTRFTIERYGVDTWDEAVNEHGYTDLSSPLEDDVLAGVLEGNILSADPDAFITSSRIPSWIANILHHERITRPLDQADILSIIASEEEKIMPRSNLLIQSALDVEDRGNFDEAIIYKAEYPSVPEFTDPTLTEWARDRLELLTNFPELSGIAMLLDTLLIHDTLNSNKKSPYSAIDSIPMFTVKESESFKEQDNIIRPIKRFKHTETSNGAEVQFEIRLNRYNGEDNGYDGQERYSDRVLLTNWQRACAIQWLRGHILFGDHDALDTIENLTNLADLTPVIGLVSSGKSTIMSQFEELTEIIAQSRSRPFSSECHPSPGVIVATDNPLDRISEYVLNRSTVESTPTIFVEADIPNKQRMQRIVDANAKYPSKHMFVELPPLMSTTTPKSLPPGNTGDAIRHRPDQRVGVFIPGITLEAIAFGQPLFFVVDENTRECLRSKIATRDGNNFRTDTVGISAENLELCLEIVDLYINMDEYNQFMMTLTLFGINPNPINVKVMETVLGKDIFPTTVNKLPTPVPPIPTDLPVIRCKGKTAKYVLQALDRARHISSQEIGTDGKIEQTTNQSNEFFHRKDRLFELLSNITFLTSGFSDADPLPQNLANYIYGLSLNISHLD